MQKVTRASDLTFCGFHKTNLSPHAAQKAAFGLVAATNSIPRYRRRLTTMVSHMRSCSPRLSLRKTIIRKPISSIKPNTR